MYLFWGILILIFFFFYCVNHWRKKKIIKKVCSLCLKEKCEILDDIIGPFGYSYVPAQDIITSRIDAWQREFGYRAFFDKTASFAGMVIDCLPVYFDYQDRTWLIEFWKGQYGMNTGCEIGVYYADRILNEDELEHRLFQSVCDEDMLKLSFTLSEDNTNLAQLCAEHWWLTAFLPGYFSYPSDLTLYASVTLQSCEMAKAFANGLVRAGYRNDEIRLCGSTVSFTFSKSAPICGRLRRLRIRIVQWINRLWCKIYRFITRPFKLTIDRLLYLYYYLPFIFRRIFRAIKHCEKRRKKCITKGKGV